ncbi:MAG TPA: rhomboid family intramembrane serine protease [Verrucomicrobiae bacterium]|nr:rhomboid family intramembrane serine protease [Verrucomicrobiae bacterium]
MIPLSDQEHRPNKFPIITVLLIAINVYFFLTVNPASIELYALNVSDFLAGRNLITLITSMFLHAGWLHIIFNMWSLWIFGDNVEDDLGMIGYLLLYFVSGIVGSLAFVFLTSDPNAAAVGASGAIAGVMGAYLVLHPRNRVLALIPIGPFLTTARIGAPAFILMWFAIQFIGLYFLSSIDSIAYSAHIGGFLTGLVLSLLLRKRPTYAY